MAHDHIAIRGARTHNLKNIDLDIPRDKFVVITGLSGSGKSSLAFDTLYAEGQRRYVESLSAYARQFLSQMKLIVSKACRQRLLSSKNRPTITRARPLGRLPRFMTICVCFMHESERPTALSMVSQWWRNRSPRWSIKSWRCLLTPS